MSQTTVGATDTRPYRQDFPIEEIKRTVSYFRGGMAGDWKRAVADLDEVESYAKGALIGMPDKLPIQSAPVSLPADPVAALEAAVTRYEASVPQGDGSAPTVAAFPWAILLPYALQLLQKILEQHLKV
jgi:hypothetical protein